MKSYWSPLEENETKTKVKLDQLRFAAGKKLKLVEWLAQTKASKLGDILQILQTADLFVNLKLNVDFFC